MSTTLSKQTAPIILPEYGDVKTACRTFSLGETKLYQLFNAGLITGVLIKKDKHSPRGKRLFSFGSIREWLGSLEASGDDAPKSDAGRMVAEARAARRQAREKYVQGL